MPSLPADFAARMQSQLGQDFDVFLKAMTDAPPVSILSNPKKHSEQPEDSTRVPWNTHGYYLSERPNYALDPKYHAGTFYPQEASSMTLGHLLPQLELPEHPLMLDLCAAPGGKSLNLLNFLDGKGHLLSNEVIRKRVGILQENITRWGHINVSLSSNPADRLAQLGPIFDLVLVDAPCSGEGLFRKDMRSMEHWSPDSVKHCSARQGRILSDIADAVKPGGWLIYSTCTYSEAENSRGIETLVALDFEPRKPEMISPWGWEWSDGTNGYQAFPHKVKGEGLFFSLFQKKGDSSERVLGHSQGPSTAPVPGWMNIPKNSTPVEDDRGMIHLKSIHLSSDQQYLSKKGRIHAQGIPIGQWKGKDFIPAHGAIMAGLEMDRLRIHLSLDQALDYLRLDTLALEGQKNGWFILNYDSFDIGWGKMVNGRLKNYYPKSWRLRQRK